MLSKRTRPKMYYGCCLAMSVAPAIKTDVMVRRSSNAETPSCLYYLKWKAILYFSKGLAVNGPKAAVPVNGLPHCTREGYLTIPPISCSSDQFCHSALVALQPQSTAYRRPARRMRIPVSCKSVHNVWRSIHQESAAKTPALWRYGRNTISELSTSAHLT